MTTLAFSPGAWMTKALYEPFLEALKTNRFPVHYADYPSLDPYNPLTADCKSDADFIQQNLRPLIEQGQDVVLVMHSYAGMPAAAAAVGLSKLERKKEGKSGGIIGLIFIGAFIVAEGLSCAGLQGGNLPPWILLDRPSKDLNIPNDPIGTFAADVDESLVSDFENLIKPHSSLAFYSPQPHPAWADAEHQGRLAFIVTAEDRAISKEAQYGMISTVGTAQAQRIVKEMACSHCAPFLSKINETIEFLKGFIVEFENGNF